MGMQTKIVDEDLHEVQLFIGGREFDLGDLSTQEGATLCRALVDHRSALLQELEQPKQLAAMLDEPVEVAVAMTNAQVRVLSSMISMINISGPSRILHISA